MASKRYQIKVGSKVVDSAARVDHAQKKYDKVVTGTDEAVVLVDTKTGEVIAKSGKAKTKKTGPDKIPGTEKRVRVHDNGDKIAKQLRGQPVEKIAAVAGALLARAEQVVLPGTTAARPIRPITPTKAQRDRQRIAQALRRAKGEGEYEGQANPGSGRMSMGLMIRKYAKLLDTEDVIDA